MTITFLIYKRDINYGKVLVAVTKDWEKAKEMQLETYDKHENGVLDVVIDEWEDDVPNGYRNTFFLVQY